MEGPPGMQAIFLFDLNPTSPFLSDLSLNNNHNAKEDFTEEKVKHPGTDDGNAKVPIILEISDRMSCSACQCVFDSREEQKEHYTLDWHQFNLKRKIKGAGILSEDDFQDRTRAGDVSSISGSDSESSDGDSGTSYEPGIDSAALLGQPSRSQKVMFKNSEGQLLVVYRCVLGAAKDGVLNPEMLLNCVSMMQEHAVMVILMAGGGHFAGAVYKGKEVLKHKTFHRYTVRAKRGTSQAVHDAQNRSHMAKSAGAALRRYNQAALRTDINQLLQSWMEDLAEARGIFLRSPRSDKALFLGRNSPIPQKDPRVHRIPFSTRRATFREVQRVHTQLFTLDVYESGIPVPGISGTREKAVKSRKLLRPETKEETADAPELSEEEVPVVEEYVEEEVTLSTLHLREYELQPKRKRKKKPKKVASESSDHHNHADGQPASQETVDLEHHTTLALEGDELCRMRNALFTCCKTGDSETAKRILQDLLPCPTPQTPLLSPPAMEVLSRLVNEHLPLQQRTLLHVAASAGHGEMACLLMDAGWDPAVRDSTAQTPYSMSADKRTRNNFRKYREDNPDKYNYSKSQIPGPVSGEVEERRAEKKRAQKAQRKQKEKEEKEERLRKEAEEDMKRRFAALSDREKRALAAERRLAAQLTPKETAGYNVRRCWLCGESLSGKVPFEYLDFSFCSTRCLQAHRRSQGSKSQK
ncbi:tRNA endonuclease ANKZF1 isoform X2 [Pseudophryne corroboree]|uniref:tRNA endonuclease ANKZF1 isoform X2 n=1 Tax=Pseudophryne corroboree TaxID=495146 RepID=UPI00308131EC